MTRGDQGGRAHQGSGTSVIEQAIIHGLLGPTDKRRAYDYRIRPESTDPELPDGGMCGKLDMQSLLHVLQSSSR
jgi:hypothetical protein